MKKISVLFLTDDDKLLIVRLSDTCRRLDLPTFKMHPLPVSVGLDHGEQVVDEMWST